MKKKFINGLLLAALFVGFTGSMVSCKDYDDEKVVNLEGKLNDLKAALEAQKQLLEGQISALSTEITNCKATCASFRELVEKTYLTISEFNTFKDGLGNIYYTKAQVDEKIKAAFEQCYTKAEIDALFAKYYTKEQIDSMFYTKEQLEAMFGKYYTKEEIDAMIKNYYTKTEIDQLFTEKLKDFITKEAVGQTIIELLEKGDQALINALNTYFLDPIIEQYLKDGKGADIINDHINKALIEVNTKISEAKSLAQQAKDLADANKLEIEGLKASVDALSSNIVKLGEDLDKVRETANDAKAKAEANAILIAKLQESYSAIEGRLSDLEGDFSIMTDNLNEISDELKAMKEKAFADSLAADALHREMLETISGLVTAVGELDLQVTGLEVVVVSLTGAVSDLQGDVSDLQGDVSDLQGDVSDLQGDVTGLKGDVSELLNKVGDLQSRLDEAVESINANADAIAKLTGVLNNVMAKFITGIEINGTYNPMFGSFSLPVDIRSNVLLTYYGQLDDWGIEFPTMRPAYYALDIDESDTKHKLTQEDIDIIGGITPFTMAGNQNIVSKMENDGTTSEGNAGTLYLTVNPTNRDFTDTQFDLINSRNEVSAFSLSNLAKSDHLLTFGYTRAGVASQSENGFYEAKATLKAEDLGNAESLKFDVDAAKDIVDDIRNYKNGINVTRIMSSIYEGISSVIEAKAVKTTWTDDLGTRSLVSQYSIAAAAVKPLSYAFAKDADDYNGVPGLGIIHEIADHFLNEITDKFPSLAKYEITHLELKNFDASTMSITLLVTVTKNGVTKTEDATFNLSSIVTLGPDSNIDAEDIQGLVDDLNSWFAQYNTISVDSLSSKISRTLQSFLDEINDRYGHYFNPNRFMQPQILVKANGSYARLSESANYPAHVSAGKMYLLPTTFNAEILSPAFKKFLAVTNVSKDGASAKDGDSTCKSLLDEANTQKGFKQVIDGGYNGFMEFTAKAGYTYEILYSAVDYAGKVVVSRFYVMVNE
ncbi:MAG: hypothetical protein K5683_07700 [Prevotella sp.]|nr:hypothetical protein [Prevotella sp.]